MSLGIHCDANITPLGRNPNTSHWFVIDEMFKIEELRYRHCQNLRKVYFCVFISCLIILFIEYTNYIHKNKKHLLCRYIDINFFLLINKT